MTSSLIPHTKNLREYALSYLQEFLELFVALSGFSLVMKRDQNTITNILKFSFIFAFIGVCLEHYDPKYKTSLRAGFIASIGSRVISKV